MNTPPNPETTPKFRNNTLYQTWQHNNDTLRQVLREYVPLTEDDERSLETNFWQTFQAIVEQAGDDTSAMMQTILDRAEEITWAEAVTRQSYFEKNVAPKLKRRAFFRGLLHMPNDPLTDYDQMMEEFDDDRA